MKEKLKHWLLDSRKARAFLNDFKRSPGVLGIDKKDDLILSVTLSGFDFPFFARNYPHTDIKVLKQIFIDKEYKPIVDYLYDNLKVVTHARIIDAGANVGYFSLYIRSLLHAPHIACVEPDDANLEVLKRNLQDGIRNGEIIAYRNGLGAAGGKFLKIDHSFRGGKDWSLAVAESHQPTGLESITIRDIMVANKWELVDVLKIDIEGGERFLFSPEADISFLDVVKLISLEIHDEFDCRDLIYEALRKKDFIILNFGETTLAINKKYC
jgi:FkbM family methyltransferase